jgi:hypothetical protein
MPNRMKKSPNLALNPAQSPKVVTK